MGVNLKSSGPSPCSVVRTALLVTCCSVFLMHCAAPQQGLRERIDATATALRLRDTGSLYAMHHPIVRAELDPQAFAQRVQRNPDEARELAGSLEASSANPKHTAQVQMRNGETIGLVFENGGWAVHEGPFGAADLSTPWAALRALRGALRHESLGSLRTVLGGELRAKRDFALQMLLEQTADVHALKYTHDEATGTFKETATFETPAGIHIVFVKEGEHWFLEHIQATASD